MAGWPHPMHVIFLYRTMKNLYDRTYRNPTSNENQQKYDYKWQLGYLRPVHMRKQVPQVLPYWHNDTTLRTRLTQNKVTKVPSTRHSKQKRSRFSFDNTKLNSPSSKSSTSLCSPCNSRASPPTSPETPITPELASPQNEGLLIDVNLFDYQTPVPPVPIELLSNLQRDQLRSVFELEQRVYDV